ncbi:MAG TPA: hypothetical protein VNW97_19005 [Candidatus Saccharimonadales bacterium]|nr:hypothetical protein [Candidatus Saccharimonadales bacterium]
MLALICGVAACGVAASSVAAQTARQPGAPVPACDPQLTASPSGRAPCDGAPAPAVAAADDSASHPAEDPSPAAAPVLRYTPSLNGGDPIIVPQPFRLRYLFGGEATQGFDSAVAGPFRHLPTGVSVLDGYAAVSMQGRRSYVLVQHASTVTRYSSSELQGQVFHRTAVLADGDLSQSVNWSLEGRSTLGDDSLHLVNPLPARLVGQFATAEPVSAAYGINGGRIWGGDLSGSLSWKPDMMRTIKLQFRDAYHQTFADGLHNNIANIRFEYLKKASERTSYGFYGQGTRETGTLTCDSRGAGFEVAAKLAESALAELAAGPEFGSSGCGRRQAVNVHMALAGTLNSSMRAYVAANREFSSGYVRRGTWEDNVVAGIGKRFSRQISWGLDAGYVKGTLLGSVLTYHGYFASTEIRKRLSESLTVLATYRRFDHSISNQGVRRNVVMFSLLWTPARHNAERSDPYMSVGRQGAVTESGHEN